MATLMDGKTPKMLLVEICAKKNMSITWQPTEIRKMPPIFRIVVSVAHGAGVPGGLKLECMDMNLEPATVLKKTLCIYGFYDDFVLLAEGHGATKKDAEQSAAIKMIPKLVTLEEVIGMSAAYKELAALEMLVLQSLKKSSFQSVTVAVADSVTTPSKIDSNIAPDVEVKIDGEPVGELFTRCRHLQLPDPEFWTINEQKAVGNKILHGIQVSAGGWRHESFHSKKMEAKKLAAYHVLQKLKTKGIKPDDRPKLPVDAYTKVTVSSGSSSEDHMDCTPSYVQIQLDNSSNMPSCSSSSHDMNIKESGNESESSENEIEILEEIRRTRPSNSIDPGSSSLSALKDLAVEMNAKLKFYCVNTPLITHEENKTLVMLTVIKNTGEQSNGFHGRLQKKHTIAGVGSCFWTAQENAAMNALKYFCDVMFTD